MTALSDSIKNQDYEAVASLIQNRPITTSNIAQVLRKFRPTEGAIRIALLVIERSQPSIYNQKLLKRVIHLAVQPIIDGVIDIIKFDDKAVELALSTAALMGDIRVVARLLPYAGFSSIVFAAIQVCKSIPNLQGARQKAQFQVLRLLVDDRYGVAFHPKVMKAAIQSSCWKLVVILLAIDEDGRTLDLPLSLAIKHEKYAIADRIMPLIQPGTLLSGSLYYAVVKGRCDFVIAIQRLNREDLSGYSPPADITEQMVELLIRNSSDPVLLANKALDHFCAAGWTKIVLLLAPRLTATRFNFVMLGRCSANAEISQILLDAFEPSYVDLLLVICYSRFRDLTPSVIAPFMTKLPSYCLRRVIVYGSVLVRGIGPYCRMCPPDYQIWGHLNQDEKREWVSTLTDDVRQQWLDKEADGPISAELKKFGYYLEQYTWMAALRCAKPL